MQSENSVETDELNWGGGGAESVQEKQEKIYPDWKKNVFVEMMEVSCCAAEIKGREDF